MQSQVDYLNQLSFSSRSVAPTPLTYERVTTKRFGGDGFAMDSSLPAMLTTRAPGANGERDAPGGGFPASNHDHAAASTAASQLAAMATGAADGGANHSNSRPSSSGHHDSAGVSTSASSGRGHGGAELSSTARPQLPGRHVDNSSIEDAYVDFVLHCNPAVPLDVDTAALREAFRTPPRSGGQSFSIFMLYQLIRQLDVREIKTWAELALKLGVQPPDQDKGQSSQKIQQYAVRLKRWMHSMHVDAFFDYLMDRNHPYWTHIPYDPNPIGDILRDGVAAKDDMALRSLLPEIKPRRGRRRPDDDADQQLLASQPPALRPRLDESSEDLNAAQPSSALAWSASGGATPTLVFTSLPASDSPMSAHPQQQQMLSAGGPRTPPAGSSWSVTDVIMTPTTAYPQSAITPSTRQQFWADEPKSAITPTSANNSRLPSRRHGAKVVSSAWRSSGTGGSRKTRGRPPINRHANQPANQPANQSANQSADHPQQKLTSAGTTQDSPFSVFPSSVDHSSATTAFPTPSFAETVVPPQTTVSLPPAAALVAAAQTPMSMPAAGHAATSDVACKPPSEPDSAYQAHAPPTPPQQLTGSLAFDGTAAASSLRGSRPGRLSLQVPPRKGGEVRLATPPIAQMNEEQQQQQQLAVHEAAVQQAAATVAGISAMDANHGMLPPPSFDPAGLPYQNLGGSQQPDLTNYPPYSKPTEMGHPALSMADPAAPVATGPSGPAALAALSTAGVTGATDANALPTMADIMNSTTDASMANGFSAVASGPDASSNYRMYDNAEVTGGSDNSITNTEKTTAGPGSGKPADKIDASLFGQGGDRTNVDGVEAYFLYEFMFAAWYDASGKRIPCGSLEECEAVIATFMNNLKKTAPPEETFLINLSALAGAKLIMGRSAVRVTRLETTDEYNKYDLRWELRFGKQRGQFSMTETVPHNTWARLKPAVLSSVASSMGLGHKGRAYNMSGVSDDSVPGHIGKTRDIGGGLHVALYSNDDADSSVNGRSDASEAAGGVETNLAAILNAKLNDTAPDTDGGGTKGALNGPAGPGGSGTATTETEAGLGFLPGASGAAAPHPPEAGATHKHASSADTNLSSEDRELARAWEDKYRRLLALVYQKDKQLNEMRMRVMLGLRDSLREDVYFQDE